MKKCQLCGHEYDDDALACPNCRHRTYEPGVLTPTPKTDPQIFVSKIPHLTTEKDGRISVLKCRTPSEAFLIAGELEAADILVMFPNEEEMMEEFKTHGYVSIRVSSQAYATAKELQGVIECRQWQQIGDQRLSIKMALVAFGLGMLFIPGLVFFFVFYKNYEKKGYTRKANSLGKWFVAGFVIVIFLFALMQR